MAAFARKQSTLNISTQSTPQTTDTPKALLHDITSSNCASLLDSACKMHKPTSLNKLINQENIPNDNSGFDPNLFSNSIIWKDNSLLDHTANNCIT